MAGMFRTFGKGGANEDHARSDEEVDPFFVETKSARAFLEDDETYPFIVGAKGAGKSLLLFKKRGRVRQRSGTLVLPDRLRAFVPSQAFADLVALSHYWQLWEDGEPRMASWTALWQWALMRTIVSGWRAQAYCHRNDEQLALLRKLAATCNESFVPDAGEEDPFAIVRQLLERIDGNMQVVRGILRLPSSDEYARFVSTHADSFPQTYVFIDNHDDFFEKNADFWVASAMGTFLAARFVREVSRGRIHFFVTVRPEVVWRLQSEDNFLVYKSEIHRIQWTKAELLELFARRIRRLRPELLASPEYLAADPIKSFLGVGLCRPRSGPPMLRNRRAEADVPIYENAGDFILRNTLRRPRDLIVMGNQILEAMGNAEQDQSDWSPVRSGIESGRELIARAYVAEVRNRWPWTSAPSGSLPELLRRLPRNILTQADVDQLEAEFLAQPGNQKEERSPFEVLISLALVGYVTDEVHGPTQIFSLAGETSIHTLPNTDWYVVNPVLYGSPFDVPVVRGLVVGRGLEFDRFLAEELVGRASQSPRLATERAGAPDGGDASTSPTVPKEREDNFSVAPSTLRGPSQDSEQPSPTPDSSRVPHVVFLAANPSDLDRVFLDREARAIKHGIVQANGGGRLVFDSEWAVTVQDLLRALQARRPEIVHFSGHGAGRAGIYLHQGEGGAVPVATSALSDIFEVASDHVRLVVLNACKTHEQAEAISQVVEFVVGTRDAVSDEASRAFSEAFYTALAFRQTVSRAFRLGRAAAEASAAGYGQYFDLWSRKDRDPNAAVLVPARPSGRG
jgi:hypothetical protein